MRAGNPQPGLDDLFATAARALADVMVDPDTVPRAPVRMKVRPVREPGGTYDPGIPPLPDTDPSRNNTVALD